MHRLSRRTVQDGRRTTGALAAALVAAALLGACGVLPGSSGVLDTGVDPVPLEFGAPTYAAAVPDGLLVRSGDAEQVLPDADDGRWLPDGTALIGQRRGDVTLRVLDPAVTGSEGEGAVPVPGFDLPGRSVTQVNILDRLSTPAVLTAYSPSLERLWTLRLPLTDNPDANKGNELERNYYNVAPTIDGVTFVQWHDGSEWYEDGDYGVARIEDGEVTNVLLNERIVALYLSADGSALLALRQSKGEPCGGCVVEQEIVEIDPATGEIAGEYGMPDEYVREWRVAAIDKVGDRVAVRFTESVWGPEEDDEPAPTTKQRGTWTYDGSWSMLEGSTEELAWWQGDDRVVARVDPSEPFDRDGFDLMWISDGKETPLRGELEASFGRRYVTGSVAGQLLPPVE